MTAPLCAPPPAPPSPGENDDDMSEPGGADDISEPGGWPVEVSAPGCVVAVPGNCDEPFSAVPGTLVA
jgi:hypothetical protein